MNSAVASVLNKVLGDFIDNLNPAQLNLSVFKGKVNLRNLSLKPKVMDLLGVPFKLKFGIIGKIDVDIPWSSLGSTPLVVNIEDIVALVSPKPDKQWSQIEMQKNLLEARQEAIDNFEALNHPEFSISEEPGYVASLIEKIVNNVQVHVKRVYLRYEDKITSEFPFCIGVKILEASVFTCNEQWKPDYVSDSQVCYKAACLKELSVFVDYKFGVIDSKNTSKGNRGEVLFKLMIDDFAGKIPHKYVLHPFSVTAQLVLYKSPGPGEAKVVVMLKKQDEIMIDVQLEQVSIVIRVLNYLSIFDIFKAGVLKILDLHPMPDSLKPEYNLKYMKFRQEYLKNPDSKLAEKLKKELSILEEKLTTESIKKERNFIIKALEIEKNIVKKQKEIEEVKKEGEGSVSKIFGFFAGKSEKEKQKELEDKQKKIMRLKSEIDSFNKGKNDLEAQKDAIEIKQAEVTRVKISVALAGLKLSVLDGEQLLTSNFKDFVLNIDSSLSVCILISLNSIQLTPNENLDNIFPFLLVVAPLEFEYTGTLLKYSCKGVEVNVNLPLIMKIVNTLLSRINEATDLNKLISKTTSTVSHYIGSGQSYMKSVLKEGVQPSLILDIKLKAPILYIPGVNPNEYLIVDLGQLSLLTENKEGKTRKYENYKIRLENFRIFKAKKHSQAENWKNENQILKPAKVHLDFRIYSMDQNTEKSMFKIILDLFNADWLIRIPDIKFILQLVSMISTPSEKHLEPEAESVEPIEVHSLSEDIKDFGQIQPWEFRVKMNSLKLSVADEISEQFFLELANTELNFSISNKERLQMFFSIENFQIIDKKVENFKEIILRSKESKYNHIRLIIDYNPELLFTEISLALEDSCIFVNKSTIDHALVLVDEILALFPPPVPVKTYPKTFTKTHTKFLVSVILMGISIKVPLNPKISNSNLTTVAFSSFVSYTSVTTMKTFYDKNNTICYSEYLELQDEAVANLTHFCILEQSPTTGCNNTILKPSRLSVSYYGNSQGEESLKRVDINTESLCVSFGFYDIFAINKIVELLSFPSGPKKDGEAKKKNTGKFVLNLDGDALQIDLVKDTGKKQKQILHLQLSNVIAFVELENDSQDISFSTLVYCRCFNRELGAWEPLMEDWKVEFSLRQQSATSPLLIIIKSDIGLDLNVNSSILSQISKIISSLSHQFTEISPLSSREKSLKKSGFQYKIINEITETITISLNYPQNKEKWEINPNGTYEFSQNTIDQLFISSNPFFKTTASLEITQKASTLNLEVQGFEKVSGLSFEEIEIRGFWLKSSQTISSCALITSSNGLMRYIRITNGLEISNNTSIDMEFSYLGCSFTVYKGQSRQLPIFFKGELDCILIKNLIFETLITGNLLFIHNLPLAVECFEYQVQGDSKFLTIEINPAYSFSNLLPGKMKIFAKDHALCEIEVGNKAELSEYLSPNTKFFISFETVQGTYETEEFELNESLKTIQIKGKNGSINVELIDQDLRKNSMFDLSQTERTKRSPSQSSSKTLRFYIENIILNKTNSDLVFSDISLPKNSWIIFSGPKGKVKIEKPPTSYCKPFSLATVSLSGSLEVPCKSDNSVMNLGVNISMASTVISQTKIVKIVPRYILSNTLGNDLYIKRFESEFIELVKHGETLIYDPKKNSAAVQVSADKENWSGAFALETLGDFQVRYLVNKDKSENNSKKSWKTGRFQYIRVLVFTKDEATIFISFVEPQEPDYLIINHSPNPITLTQANLKSHEIVLKAGKSTPWAFDNLLVPVPKILLTMGEHKGQYSLDKIKTCKDLGKNMVKVTVKDTTRALEIQTLQNQIEKSEHLMKDPKILKFSFSLSKIGISIIDAANVDMIYVCLNELTGKMKIIEENLKEMNRKVSKYDLRAQEFQIDNMYINESLFPVILNKLVYKNSEEEDLTPFLQVKVHTERIEYFDGNPAFDKIRWLEFSIRPITVKINEETIFSLIALKDFFTVFNSAPSVDLTIDLDVSPPKVPTEYTTIKSKAYFEFFRICAIKFEITFRKSSSPKELSYQSKFFPLNIIKSVGSAFINISSAPISFTEILITHGFQTIDNLTEVLIKNMIRQAIVQVFKILGSSDMIGNPVGLLDKLGTGVFEFVNEPAKGLLKGPKSFAQGIGKGVRSLVGAVVAGGFGSVSKITGSLYNVLNEVGGDEAAMERSDSKIGDNLYHGLKGGVKDISSGITGIFTKPFKGAKEGGAKGFFKGVGTGLFGLISTPFKVVLKIGSTLTSGIAAGATLLSKGKIQTFGRCRFPRQTNHSRMLEPYNNDLAQAKELMRQEGDQKIISYSHIVDKNDIIFIITDHLIWIMNNEEVLKLKIKDLTNIEINLNKDTYYLDIGGKNKRVRVPSDNFGVLVPLYYSITSITGPIAPFNNS